MIYIFNFDVYWDNSFFRINKFLFYIKKILGLAESVVSIQGPLGYGPTMLHWASLLVISRNYIYLWNSYIIDNFSINYQVHGYKCRNPSFWVYYMKCVLFFFGTTILPDILFRFSSLYSIVRFLRALLI